MDLLVSFLLGVASSSIVVWIANLISSCRNRKKFESVIGDYIGYGFEDDDANPLVQKKEPQSKATVRYVNGNILQIEVEHDNRKWDGDIAMENGTFGTVVWRYTDYPEHQHMFGFKRMTVINDAEKVLLYLVGERPVDPFGKEMFIRHKAG